MPLPFNHRVATAVAISVAALLAGCGGGNGLPDQPLSIADGTPTAYTVDYLSAHPNLLVQPEHLIIARLDPKAPNGDRQSVRLYIREPMTLSLGSAATASALSEVTIEDDDGAVQMRHDQGDDAATATLAPGSYQLVFRAAPGLAAPQTLFLKLADTPAQAAERQMAPPQIGDPNGGGLLGATPSTGTPTGIVSGDECMNCKFDGADLSNQDLSNTVLGGSTFLGTTLYNTNFTRAYLYQTQFTNNAQPGNTNFTEADLDEAQLNGNFYGVTFCGALLQQAILKADFMNANFSPSAAYPTRMHGANLVNALLYGANIQHADLSGASVRDDTTFFEVGTTPPANAFVGVTFDNMTPSSPWTHINFAGMDLTGASFAGIDMSHADLSVASGTKITPAGLAKAILSNGTTGANLAGQDFGTAYAAWAGSYDGTMPGANLAGVNLTGANLYEANLTGVNLSGAVLIGADLTNSSLARAQLVGALLGVTPDSQTASAANLSGAYMPQADFTDADLRSVKFDNAHVYGAVKFIRARLDSASMVGTNLGEANFSQASLTNTQFRNAVLVNANFSSANLQNADLYGSYVQGASFVTTASVAGANLENAYVSTASGSWSFTESDSTPFVYSYDATALGDLGSTVRGTATCPSGELGPCTGTKLQPTSSVPYPPPPPACIPVGPDYDNCLPPS